MGLTRSTKSVQFQRSRGLWLLMTECFVVVVHFALSRSVLSWWEMLFWKFTFPWRTALDICHGTFATAMTCMLLLGPPWFVHLEIEAVRFKESTIGFLEVTARQVLSEEANKVSQAHVNAAAKGLNAKYWECRRWNRGIIIGCPRGMFPTRSLLVSITGFFSKTFKDSSLQKMGDELLLSGDGRFYDETGFFALNRLWKNGCDHDGFTASKLAAISWILAVRPFWVGRGSRLLLWFFSVRWRLPSTEQYATQSWAVRWGYKDKTSDLGDPPACKPRG